MEGATMGVMRHAPVAVRQPDEVCGEIPATAAEHPVFGLVKTTGVSYRRRFRSAALNARSLAVVVS
jgi:hypothetical protein